MVVGSLKLLEEKIQNLKFMFEYKKVKNFNS